jgi:hypothetical protein
MNVQVFNISCCSLCLEKDLPFGFVLDDMHYCVDCHSKLIHCAECKRPLNNKEFDDKIVPMRGRICAACRCKCQMCRNEFSRNDYMQVQAANKGRLCIKCVNDVEEMLKYVADLTEEDMIDIL